MKHSLPILAAGAALAMLAAPTWGKLPPPSDEAKAKAAEAAAKAVHAAKVDAFKLCKSMDAVAAGYYAQARKDGRTVNAPVETPACADPGPFVYAPPAAPGAAAPAASPTAPAAPSAPAAPAAPAAKAAAAAPGK